MKLQARIFLGINRFRLQLKARRFRGSEFHCPLCGFNAAAFLPSPGGERKNVRCPRCDSLERHRAQWLFGLKMLPFTPESRISVLHVTPEFCITDRLLRTWSRAHYSTSQYPRDFFADYAIDVQQIPLPAQSIDLIICNHVLEHVPDDRAALAELFRVMKPGGYAFVQVPVEEGRSETFEDPSVTSTEKRRELFGQEDHVRLYGMDFAQRLEDAGFSVSVVKFWEMMSAEDRARHALTDQEPLFIGNKKAGSSDPAC